MSVPKLREFPSALLERLLETLQAKGPVPTVNPTALATEEGRLKLAREQGRYEIVQEVAAELRRVDTTPEMQARTHGI